MKIERVKSFASACKLAILIAFLFTVLGEMSLYFIQANSDYILYSLVALLAISIIFLFQAKYWYIYFLIVSLSLLFCIPVYLVISMVYPLEHDPGMFVNLFYFNGLTMLSIIIGSFFGFIVLGVISLSKFLLKHIDVRGL